MRPLVQVYDTLCMSKNLKKKTMTELKKIYRKGLNFYKFKDLLFFDKNKAAKAFSQIFRKCLGFGFFCNFFALKLSI